jgi:DNA-binding MarR family transcriptional regulator
MSAVRRPGAVRPRPSEPPRLQDDVGYLLSRAGGMAVRAFNDVMEPLGLRTRQYAVLAYITEHGYSTQRHVAEALDLDPSTVVALVDDLEAAGWAERRQNPQDRRTRLIGVTTAGRKALRTAAGVVGNLNDELLAPLADEERETLRELLRRVITPAPGVP